MVPLDVREGRALKNMVPLDVLEGRALKTWFPWLSEKDAL